jgi:L-lactate utilization protein LutB
LGCRRSTSALAIMTRALHDAAAAGDVVKVRKLVAEGADIEARASDGTKPIHRAAHAGQVEAIQVLIELGADKEARTIDGGRPLHCAADHGHVEAVRAPLLATALNPVACGACCCVVCLFVHGARRVGVGFP